MCVLLRLPPSQRRLSGTRLRSKARGLGAPPPPLPEKQQQQQEAETPSTKFIPAPQVTIAGEPPSAIQRERHRMHRSPCRWTWSLASSTCGAPAASPRSSCLLFPFSLSPLCPFFFFYSFPPSLSLPLSLAPPLSRALSLVFLCFSFIVFLSLIFFASHTRSSMCMRMKALLSGYLQKHPFCDMSHVGTGHQPVLSRPSSGKVLLCQCKKSGSFPFFPFSFCHQYRHPLSAQRSALLRRVPLQDPILVNADP